MERWYKMYTIKVMKLSKIRTCVQVIKVRPQLLARQLALVDDHIRRQAANVEPSSAGRNVVRCFLAQQIYLPMNNERDNVNGDH